MSTEPPAQTVATESDAVPADHATTNATPATPANDLEKSSTADGKEKKEVVFVSGGIPVDEMEFPDEKLRTTRREIWSYYLFYVGNSGLGPPTQYQNLLALAGHNLGQPGVACDYSVPCVLPFAGIQERNINSIVLVTNGISFAVQVVLFLIIGGAADFGRWRPWILIGFTIVSLAISFAWLGVEKASQWETATGLYIVGLICYQGALTFYNAAFVQLARNLPEMQESQAKLINGETTPETHNILDSMSRNRLSNMSFTICSVGEMLVLFILLGVLKGVHSDRSVEDNTKALSVVSAYSAAVWIVFGLPWFFFEKHRPGQIIPEGSNIVSVAVKNVWIALKEAWKLTDTMIYLVFYFLMSDVLNTGVTLISTLQYSILSYNTFKLTELLIVGIFTQVVGIYVFWFVQKTYQISTSRMFFFVVFWINCLMLWGMIGTWTQKIGFHHEVEIWLYQALYGLLVCPWYSYSQTMISEFIPEGKEFLFFALFSITGKTSAFIGPFVTSAIVARTNNTNTGFIFLLALGVTSSCMLPFLSVKRSRKQCADYIAKDRREILEKAAAKAAKEKTA